LEEVKVHDGQKSTQLKKEAGRTIKVVGAQRGEGVSWGKGTIGKFLRSGKCPKVAERGATMFEGGGV